MPVPENIKFFHLKLNKKNIDNASDKVLLSSVASAAQIFIKSMNRRVGELSAYWPLGSPVSLGDYGTYTQGFFQRLGNIFEEELVPKELSKFRSGPAAHHEFETEGKVSTNFQIGADVVIPGFSVNSKFSIQFSGNEAFYFNALMARVVQLESPARIGAILIELDEKGGWKRDYHVVTTLVRAEKVRFLISGDSSKVEFVLGAKNDGAAAAPIPTQLDAALSWIKTGESSLSYEYMPELMAEAILDTPFFQLHKVSRKTFPFKGPRYWDTMNANSRGFSVRVEETWEELEEGVNEETEVNEYSFEVASFFDDSSF